MSVVFEASQILSRSKGITFADVILVPRYSEVTSRTDPTLETKLTSKTSMKIPFISANMDTITEAPMALSMARLGGLGIIHRFMTLEEQINQVKKLRLDQEAENITTPISASVGVKEEGQKRAIGLAEAGAEILTLDIAHGDSIHMMEMIEFIKKNVPHVQVIAGNIATAEGTKRLINAGADAVKCGIGPGSMCTTRLIAGHGVPQLTAIAWCVEAASPYGVPVIADGGIKTSGDIVKALSVGASTVMVGGLLSGTLETPGAIQGGKKLYRGMASKNAQVSWRGELPEGMSAEGESHMVSCKGPVSEVINELCGGLRSGMTYMGAREILQMSECSLFMEVTSAGMMEATPHGLK